MMLSFADWFTRPNEVELERAARRIAQASLGPIRSQLRANWRNTSTSEARGYVRAKSRRTITQNVRRQMGSDGPLPASQLASLVERAMHISSERLLRELPSESAAAVFPRHA